MNDRFGQRRSTVIEQLGSTAALVLAAAPEIVVGRDTELRYTADAELYYLTGYTEPEAILVLGPADGDAPFTMFVRPRDEARELWTGKRGGEEAARELFGADAAHPVSELAERLPILLASVDVVYTRLGAGRPDVDGVLMRLLGEARRTRPRTGSGPQTLTDPGALLDALRVIKDADELAAIREAARISCEAFLETLTAVRPGMGEWEVEAALEYGFRARGGDGPAFPTIAAAGANATVLHYIENRGITRDGDLLLLDAGARARMYCADITRTVPVSGRFSSEQRAIYDVVLGAHAVAVATARPGATFDAVHTAAKRALADGLIGLGIAAGPADALIESENGLSKYYPHRTGHWLGLDVHDVGPYATRDGSITLVPGMVMTIEPGLYLAERGIGIRIEDDVVITADGCDVLTAAVPATAEQIEALMSGRSA